MDQPVVPVGWVIIPRRVVVGRPGSPFLGDHRVLVPGCRDRLRKAGSVLDVRGLDGNERQEGLSLFLVTIAGLLVTNNSGDHWVCLGR